MNVLEEAASAEEARAAPHRTAPSRAARTEETPLLGRSANCLVSMKGDMKEESEQVDTLSGVFTAEQCTDSCSAWRAPSLFLSTFFFIILHQREK